MKVLFLSQIVPYPPHGGVLQRGYNVVRELSKEHEIYLLAFIHPDILSSEESVENGKTELKKFCKSVEFFDLWTKRSYFNKILFILLSFIYPRPFSVLAHRSKKYRERIRKILHEQDIDIVHFDTIALAQYLDYCTGIPAVVTHHNIESKLIERRSKVEKNLLARLFFKLQARRLKTYELSQSPKFDVNIMVSELEEAEYRNLMPGIVTEVVHNGVDTDYFVPTTVERENAVIYTGGMNMFANYDAVMHFVLDILPAIKTRIPDVKFYIIGQDPPKTLKDMAKSDSSLKILGFVDDIRPYVAKAAVYVVPLRVGGGTRLKVVDALAQGKAIVSTRVGCEGLTVTDGENIIIEDAADKFADKVVRLIQDAPFREKLEQEARNLAEQKYAWSVVGKNLLDCYRSLGSE